VTTQVNVPSRRGLRGPDGWSPIYANVPDGPRVVQQLVGWYGGEGEPPATGQYVGPVGLVTAIAQATDIRGAGDLIGANNLSDVASASAALANLGGVPGARIISGSGLATGGGSLAANRTIDVPVATQAEAEAGASNSRAMTPLRVAQFVASVSGAPSSPSAAKHSAYTVVPGDQAITLILSGSDTLSLSGAATLGPTFAFHVLNAGAGVWTIDPSGAETINGRAAIKVYPGESFRVQCTGTTFFTVGRPTRVTQTVAISSPVPQVDFENMIVDVEFTAYELHLLAVNTSTSSPIGARFKDGGSFVSTAGAYVSGHNATSFQADMIHLADGSSDARSGQFFLPAPRSTSPRGLTLYGININSNTSLGGRYASVPTGLQGIRITSTTNLASGAIRLVGHRD
jgi:hypothetical protein